MPTIEINVEMTSELTDGMLRGTLCLDIPQDILDNIMSDNPTEHAWDLADELVETQAAMFVAQTLKLEGWSLVD